jgi:signal transduction histidine kinase
VFDRFVQAPVSAPRRGGFGIGLNIAATVASVHGGRLFARNREDAGCEFVAVLPLSVEPAAATSAGAEG